MYNNIFTYSIGCTNSVFFHVNNKKIGFLVDTGASLCAIKLKYVDLKIPLHQERLEIKGIGGNLVSLGYV